MCERLGGKPTRVMKVSFLWWESSRRTHHRPIWILLDRFELERICWDPKDCELCLHRVKPGESLVEARSDTNVQIVRQM